ncbi:P-loop containing nucleoside triphosphate hydrolase protein [Trichocladium antarcticum]|uniref:ATP-dependent DNA helicase n=1 Tax=Trichocladium antarcticum TaxID=1450529 RepID=A0AAN6Z9V3_9PEZI|nr:P-loop containing nucleoside triphosphate hydrolase protein [Trichocladium antarcticum]
MDDGFDDGFDDVSDEDFLLALTQATDAAERSSRPGGGQQANERRPGPSVPVTTTTRAPHSSRPRVFAAPASRASNRTQTPGTTADFDLNDLPPDAFDSSPERASHVPTQGPQRQRSSFQSQSQSRFRQTTLWGSALREDRATGSQATNSRPFRADLPPEAPTHHELNHHELPTWVYPLNLGPIRDYQFSIVKNGLFNNTLVALPTGLGKTFIAATVILNFFRWTKDAKIVFVAPTKPLASQQVQACLGVAGIPRSQATLLTGETSPALREGEWASKRLFFMTPQTLMNDLSKGYADPKTIVLLVVDEAHRATGDYAYVKVIEFLRRFSKSFRVLALTATPGSSIEGVQDVIDNLGISHVEIRTEESLDIRQYVHSRNIDTVTFDPSDEMDEVKRLFSKALKPLVDKLTSQNIYCGRDPMSLTTYGLLKSRGEWLNGPGKHVNQGTKFMMIAVFGILQSLTHAIKLLNFHGIKPFYNSLAEFRSSEESKGGQGSKYRRQILADESFQKMMSMVEKWMRLAGFNGHPKLTYLCQALVNHFVDAGENANTRAIVFSEYRDSAEEIVRLLNTQPLISATVFVGQADSKRSEGMKQKQQIETIEKFKAGGFNVLVATSIGEEGLDIGQVDLIVCYDASSSPIRMLQRMGRTGRKRAGNILLLLMKGKEEDKFADAKDNYQKMQQLICDGGSFAFRHDLSTRILPRDIKPEVVKRHVDVPVENSQDPSLPEPKKTPAGRRKKPSKKKFNMPDGVETGFKKASFFGRPATPATKAPEKPAETDFLADIPGLEEVLLSKPQTERLNRLYKSLPKRPSGKVEDIDGLNLGAHPVALRTLRRTVNLKHGEYTRKCVKLFKTLGQYQNHSEQFTWPYGETDTTSWEKLPVNCFADDSDGEAVDGDCGSSLVHKRPRVDDWPEGETKRRAVGKKTGRSNPSSKRRAVPDFLMDCEEGDDDEDDEHTATAEATPQGRRGRGRTTKVTKGRGRFNRAGDHIEDFGDDCTRTSDMEVTDGSDSGGDLADFVVGDDALTSSLGQRSTGLTTPGSSGLSLRHRRGGHVAREEKPFYELMEFDSTQDTDDEMPDLAGLVARSSSAVKPKRPASARISYLDEDDDSDDTLRRPSPRKPGGKRRRQVLADSDDDG